MAVTSLWPIHGTLKAVVDYTENPEKTKSPERTDRSEQGFFDVLAYVANAEKTARRQFVHGINCMPETATEQMVMTKQRFGKTDGTVAFHGYQSFRYDEASPELAHQIGIEMAGKLWGDRFEIVVSTHLNTGSIHNHFVINSVSFVDGKRLNDNMALKRRIREVSDALCREHGLSVLESQSPTKTPRNIWLAERQGLDTRYNIMRRDIDDAVSRSFAPKYFYAELRRRGYIVRYDEKRKYATIQIPGTRHPTRFKTLGEEYTQECLEERVRANMTPCATYRPPPKFRPFHSRHGTLYELYRYYYDLLHTVKENRSHPYYSAALRSDLHKLDALSEQTQLLCNHQIGTMEQLQAFVDRTKTELGTLTKERNWVYTQITRCTEEGQLPDLVARRDALTAQITARRRDLKNANEIMRRSETVREKLQALEMAEHAADRSR
jgi:hypothetical protein